MLLLVLLAGCSNRAVYENIQINQRQACLNVPPPEYDACMARVSQPYEDYERERREAIEEKD